MSYNRLRQASKKIGATCSLANFVEGHGYILPSQE